MAFKLKIILLDLDGTLVDSHNAQFLVWKSALESLNINIDENDFDKVSGFDSLSAAKHFFSNRSENDWNNLITKKDSEFRNFILNIHLFAGVRELIQLARDLNCKIGIVTSAG